MSSIAFLKARVDLVEVVGRYVELVRRNGGLWAVCPFHPDRNPSFKVDPKKQRFHCFGCGADGDVVDFLAVLDGLEVQEAIRRLQEIAGATAAPMNYRKEALPAPSSAKANQELAQEISRQTVDVPDGDSLPYAYLTETRGLSGW